MVQAIAGHSDLKLTSQVYTHLGAEDLRKAIDGIPPLGSMGREGGAVSTG